MNSNFLSNTFDDRKSNRQNKKMIYEKWFQVVVYNSRRFIALICARESR